MICLKQYVSTSDMAIGTKFIQGWVICTYEYKIFVAIMFFEVTAQRRLQFAEKWNRRLVLILKYWKPCCRQFWTVMEVVKIL